MKARKDLVIPLDGKTRSFLKEMRSETSSVYVFDIPDHRAIDRAFKAAVRRAKIPECRFHDLRSTFITDCRLAGVDLEVTRDLAGHADISTTARFYRKISQEELREAMERRAGLG